MGGQQSAAVHPRAGRLGKLSETIVELMMPVYFNPEPLSDQELKLATDCWALVINDTSPAFLELRADPTCPHESCLALFYHEFYQRLFDIHPPSRPLFKDTTTQGKFLAKMISLALSEKADPAGYEKTLITLAEVHNKRGIKAMEYGIIGDVLFWTLPRCVGPKAYAGTHHAWVKIMSRMLKTMVPVAVVNEMKDGSAQKNRFLGGVAVLEDEWLTEIFSKTQINKRCLLLAGRKKYRSGSLLAELSAYRAVLAEQQRQEQAREAEELQRRQLAADLELLREKKKREEELEAKTRRFWEVNQFNRKTVAEGSPHFVGDLECKHVAWRPHGNGQFVMHGQPVVDGVYLHGELVEGKVRWATGEVWEGRMRSNCMHGPGSLTKDGKSVAVLMKDNVVQCTRDELIPGTQLALVGGTPGACASRVDASMRTLVCIVQHVRGWYFLCRFHDEQQPRDRVINLGTIGEIEILTHLPAINSIYVQADSADAASQWRTLRAAAAASLNPADDGPRKPTRCVLPPNLVREGRRRNVFESREVGIGMGIPKPTLFANKAEVASSGSSVVSAMVLS